jgi:hypothetical protein
MLSIEPSPVCFYALQRVHAVIKFDELRCMDLIGVFPGTVALRVTLPSYKILQGLATPPSPVSTGLFHFIFLFSINQIRGRLGEVRPM